MSALPSPRLQSLRLAANRRWAALAPREQRGVQLAALLVGALLMWWLLVAPALGTLRKAASQHAALDAQFDVMLGLQARAQTLQGQAVVSRADALASLQAGAAALGTAAKLQVAGDLATLTLQKVGSDALSQWLAQLGSALRLQPAQAHWTRDAGTGATSTWSGTLVFNLPSGNANSP